ncbi:MAG: T9SS type A sorting domain-containing protein [Saprospiraceae bacterium]|nr:T9SS type A sorting domain-containing protein [Saprospiraceae bacterium]
MKNLLFFITATTILCFPGAVQAQQTPQFQMTIHFEDAVGNIDSVIVGYDEEASNEELNFQFGESQITTPFDNIFEVRAVHNFDTQRRMSKKIIGNYEAALEPPYCIAASIADLIISAKHYPVTVRYDTALLNSEYCRENTIISPDTYIFLAPSWQDARIYYCASNTNKIVDNFDYYFHQPEDSWLREETEVEGEGVTYLPGYYFVIFFNDDYCATISDTEDIDTTTAPSGRLYPNPTGESSVILELNEPPPSANISLYDLNGRRLRQLTSFLQQSISIDIEGLPAGAYIVEVISSKSNKPGYYKLIRQ